jgi:hypothetical protein
MLPLRDSCHRFLRHHVRSKIPKNMALLSAIFLGIFIEGTASGQTIQTYEPPVPSAFNLASLTEPACPATTGSPLAPVTNEIHIFYYPTARPAAIKDPKSLVLHLVLGHELTPFDHQIIAFTRREAGCGWRLRYTKLLMRRNTRFIG